MPDTRIIDSQCPYCHTWFDQYADPGRRREYCSAACRQAAYRERRGPAPSRAGRSAKARQKRAQEEAFANEQARREKERERSQRRRQAASGGRGEERIVTPTWTLPRDSDDPVRRQKRAKCRLLWIRATAPGGNAEEQAMCREVAHKIFVQYGL